MKVNYLSLRYRGSHNPTFILISVEGVLVYHRMASMKIDQSHKKYEIYQNRKTADAKLNLVPNERLESFWDALWLGIRPFRYFIFRSQRRRGRNES